MALLRVENLQVHFPLRSGWLGRRDVVKAIIRTMSAYGLDDDAAYDLLRRRCMTTRQTMEDLCRELVLSPAPDDPGEPIPRERRAE